MNLQSFVPMIFLAVENKLVGVFKRMDQPREETEVEDILINMAFTTLFALLKNEKKRAMYRSAMLKAYKVIKQNFANDPDFE